MTDELPRLHVAVVHDWLTGMRGGEKVLEAILELFPSADVYTLFHIRGSVSPKIEAHAIRTSVLQPIVRAAGDYRRMLPLFPLAVEQWDLSQYDLVVSSSHCVAKGVRPALSAPHVSYCHTPMRYIWDRFDDYFPRSRPLMRSAVSLFVPFLRRWDVSSSQRVSHFVANSRFVARRIQRYYDRGAEVVHPFVDDAFLAAPLIPDRSSHHLIVSALVPYKRIDLAIEAARVGKFNLRIIGGGPLLEALRRSAPANVELVGWVDDEALRRELSNARSLILPGVEDFGITPLEAMASGTPVVALRDGGALETVLEGVTGVFFDEARADAVARAVRESETRQWDRRVLREHAAGFSRERFKQQFGDIIARQLEKQ